MLLKFIQNFRENSTLLSQLRYQCNFPCVEVLSVLASFMSILHRLGSSERREAQLIKSLQKIRLQASL